MDNFTPAEKKRLQLIQMIQRYYTEGYSIAEIAKLTRKNRHTVTKYIEGDPIILSRSNAKGKSPLEQYRQMITQLIEDGYDQAGIYKKLREQGFTGSNTSVKYYSHNLASELGLELKLHTTRNHNGKIEKAKNVPQSITRKGIINHIWMNIPLTDEHKEYIFGKNDAVAVLDRCVREFREIFRKKNIVLLFLFIERYKESSYKEIASFAKGLEHDIEAVENAVSSDYSNGFVEGTNSKVKMIKHTMYGKCSSRLLAAKLMYDPKRRYE